MGYPTSRLTLSLENAVKDKGHPLQDNSHCRCWFRLTGPYLPEAPILWVPWIP